MYSSERISYDTSAYKLDTCRDLCRVVTVVVVVVAFAWVSRLGAGRFAVSHG